MLRSSINGSNFSNNIHHVTTAAPSIHRKRGSIVNVRRTSQIATNKIPVRQSSSHADSRNSVKITISPQRIETVYEYVKFFCPRDANNDHLIEVKDIEQLFLHPRFMKDSFTSPELIQQQRLLQTTNHFLQLLQVAQMNYYEWFDFVLSRSSASASAAAASVGGNRHNPSPPPPSSSSSSETLSMEEFCSEIHRLSHDLRQSGFLPEQLQQLFFNIVQKEDPSSRMDRTQLDQAMKKYFIKEKQFRFINIAASELKLISIYMKKNHISLQSILQVTEPELKNEQIHLSQLSSLISSLLIMYEVYVSEFGIPVEDKSSQPAEKAALAIDHPQLTDNRQTDRSPTGKEGDDLPGGGTNNTDQNNQISTSIFKRSESSKSEKTSSNSPIRKILSLNVQIPPESTTTTPAASTVGNVLTTLRNSLSLKAKNAPILPEDGETEKKSIQSEPLRSSIPRNSNSLPVEINRDFIKHLDWEERTKVLLLVRHMREGDSFDANQHSIKRSTKSTRSTRNISGKYFENNEYIIISTDEGDENDDDDLLLDHELPEQPLSPNSGSKMNQITSPSRRSVINTSVNRVENLKNDVIESFNRRIGRASLIMKQNR